MANNANLNQNAARLNGFWGKVASCNVHALKNTQLSHFREVFKGHNIVCLQETHGKQSSIKMMTKRLGFKNGLFSLIQKQARGAAVLWRDGNKIAEETDTQGRIAGVALELNNHKLTVVSAYAPNVDGSHKSWENYVSFLIDLERIADELTEANDSTNLLIMGDFNLILDKELDSFSQNPKVYSFPREQLLDMTDRLGLCDAFRTFNGDARTYTFAPGANNVNKIYNRLDYAWLTPDVLEFFEDCVHKSVGNTDHKAVLLDTEDKGDGCLKGLWRHNDTLNTLPAFQKAIEDSIIQATSECKEFGSDQVKFEYIKYKMACCSREFSARLKKQEVARKKELTKLIEGAEPDKDHEKIIEAKAELQNILDKEGERVMFRSKVNRVVNDEKCSKFFYGQIKENFKRSNISSLTIENESVQDPQRIEKALADFYEALYKKEK